MIKKIIEGGMNLDSRIIYKRDLETTYGLNNQVK